jgi:hypothetical protein
VDGELLPLRLSGELLRTEDIIHAFSLRNLTKKGWKLLFPAVPEHNAVRHRHLVLFGLPECGKTELLNSIAHQALKVYGKGNVNVIAVYQISDALDLIDRRPVQLLIVDDAVKGANSRKSMAQADDVADFYEVRHIFERKAETMAGVVITIWAAQRFKSLDIVFRNAHMIIFKTAAVDPSDQKEILRYVPPFAYERLQRITRAIYEDADDSVKSESIAHFPFSNESGVFRHEMRPRILKFWDGKCINNPGVNGEIQPFRWDLEAAVQRYMNDRAWRKEARAFYLNHFEHLSQEQVGKDPAIRCAKSSVNDMIKAFRGELSRVAGDEYEIWKAAQLEAAGLQVRRRGRTGKPDILADHPEGMKYVYSCKALTIKRTISLPIEELRPELREAQRSGRELILSVYNLASGVEKEIRIDAKAPPAVVEIAPF